MITSSLGYYSFLLAFMAIVFYFCNKYKDTKLVKAIPAIIWLFIGIIICATFQVFDLKSEGVVAAQGLMYSTFLPLMLTMFMLTCDVRHIIKLGPRMIFAFLCSTFAILAGFTVGFVILKGVLPENAWASIAATCGSFIGETVNMVAVAAVFGVEGTDYAYSVMMVAFAFSIFITVMMALIPKKDKWNKHMNATTDGLDEIAKRIELEERDHSEMLMLDYLILLGICFVATWITNLIVPMIPPVSWLSATGWRVVISSLLGIALGMTKVRKLKGATEIANVFLYLSLANTATYSDLSQCTKAPWYLVLCLIMLVVMFAIWYLFSKIFKFDLFTAEVGLTANIGGTSSAPLIAAAHNPNWISFGILLGFFGDVVGTGLAVAFGYFLKWIYML